METEVEGDSDESQDPNMSERSDVLAPNNSSDEEEDKDGKPKVYDNVDAFDKDEKMDFDKQALIADEEYEREHDLNCDNGVYRKGFDINELAVKTGLKESSDPWKNRMQ